MCAASGGSTIFRHPQDAPDERSDDSCRFVGVESWAELALSRAVVEHRPDEDPQERWFACVDGIAGPWGIGHTRDEALADLESVLVEWAELKLLDGDDDIPSAGGTRPRLRAA